MVHPFDCPALGGPYGRTAPKPLGATNFRIFSRLGLALINNLGLIYDRTGETSRSETCFGNMLSTMMYLTDSNESRNVKQWDELLSNVMDILFFKQKKATYEVAAPAA